MKEGTEGRDGRKGKEGRKEGGRKVGRKGK